MAIFSYVATDNTGNRRLGTVDARTSELALSLLKTQGLYVINIVQKRESLIDDLMSIRGIPQGEVVNFTRQFSTMISAGLPLSRALEVLVEQTENSQMKKLVSDVLRDVEGGSPLSTAMGKYTKVFPNTYQALIRAGESSGKLDEILKKLANSMEANRELKGKFKAAMIYPAIVLIAMLGVFVMMMVFVIPKLAQMYESLNVELPAVTKFMIAISKLFTQRIYVIFIGSAALFVGMRKFLGSATGHEVMSWISFKAPVFGKLNKQRELAEFSGTLSLLISSAVPIVESLRIVSEVVQNHAYKDAAMEASKRVEKGSPLSEYFRSNKNLPPLLGHMSAVGEETGQLDTALEKVSEYFAGEAENSVKGLSAALEPIILVMLGGMVGVLIVSIITPIYKITSSL